jgi:hypothetical protein
MNRENKNRFLMRYPGLCARCSIKGSIDFKAIEIREENGKKIIYCTSCGNKSDFGSLSKGNPYKPIEPRPMTDGC